MLTNNRFGFLLFELLIVIAIISSTFPLFLKTFIQVQKKFLVFNQEIVKFTENNFIESVFEEDFRNLKSFQENENNWLSFFDINNELITYKVDKKALKRRKGSTIILTNKQKIATWNFTKEPNFLKIKIKYIDNKEQNYNYYLPNQNL